jgi:DNA invertase Pin-like site-specific DNA recombinase
LAAFAEFERDIIYERTMAGLAAARGQGRGGGRPTVMDDDKSNRKGPVCLPRTRVDRHAQLPNGRKFAMRNLYLR